MKKLMAILAIAIVAPVFAGSITLTDNGDGTIDWTSDVAIRALALDVDCTTGQIETVAVDSFFDIFVDFASDDPVNYAYGDGHPAADQDAAGAVTLPLASFCISAGGLGGQTLPLDPAPMAGTITMTGAGAEGTISANGLRGGVVDVDGNPVAIVGDVVAFTIGGGDPPCWSGSCFTTGDANGDGVITSLDVQALLAAWTGGYDPCTDFNKDGFITSLDVQILLAGWTSGCP